MTCFYGKNLFLSLPSYTCKDDYDKERRMLSFEIFTAFLKSLMDTSDGIVIMLMNYIQDEYHFTRIVFAGFFKINKFQIREKNVELLLKKK